MHTPYLSIALFATFAVAVPLHPTTRDVSINGAPVPPGTVCYVDGKPQTDPAACPVIPETGLICVLNGVLTFGASCPPDSPSLGKRVLEPRSYVFFDDCAGNARNRKRLDLIKVVTTCHSPDRDIYLLSYCARKCANPVANPIAVTQVGEYDYTVT